MGISVQVTGTEELARFQKMLDALSNPKLKEELLDSLGSIVETQTKIRIADEKTAPDGTPWAAWSEGYARTRHGNQSPLVGEGDLRDSIQYVVEKNQVRVGSPLVYAGVHQDGFSGAVQVDAHTRLITQAFGKALKFPVYQSVGAFSRMMDIPQRQFLGLSRDNQTEVYDVIGDFWQEVLQ
ncbi:phage virion morphogenesis protein [Vibrio cholerae]|nr:phage morphogeneis protein [Vibrio cholerae]